MELLLIYQETDIFTSFTSIHYKLKISIISLLLHLVEITASPKPNIFFGHLIYKI